MSVAATVLFDTPQREIASLLRSKLASSIRTQIVAGFATVEGMMAIQAPISFNPNALETFVIGAGTYRAYEAFDQLLGLGVAADRLWVHLGHTRHTGGSAKHRFYRYHPMLHSKVYYMEYADGSACAVIGSHNVTGFALLGLNGEAAVLLEGDKRSAEFAKIRNHIAAAKAEAIAYNPGMKDGYSWWTHQFMEGLADKANDLPRDGESKKTIVILCEATGGQPQKDDLIYFELPEALGKVSSLRAEVHIYVFPTLPPTPMQALANLHMATVSFWCRTVGLEEGRGGVELKADWELRDYMHPRLSKTTKPFRPRPSSDHQQVRVQVYNSVHGAFEYLFGLQSQRWLPQLDQNQTIELPIEEQYQVARLELIPPEDKPWFLVKGLTPAEAATSEYVKALEGMSPESGSYVLMSLRRKEAEPPNDKRE